MSTWKIAGIQMDCILGEVERNLDRIEGLLLQTHQAGVKLAIFPECALTGYCFDSREEAVAYGQTIPGPATERIQAVTSEHGLHVIVGLLERDGDRLFNAVVLIGPNGVIGSYRKIHLPFLGVDRFTDPGDRPFEVFDVEDMRVGMHICYDGSFPESARIMALDGADLIALPTNWPPGSECASEHMVATRAMENTVYYAAVNRVGKEKGFRFIGGSRICDPSGKTLAAGDSAEETILYATIELERARTKQLIRVPKKHEINRIQDRRPEFYGPLTQPVRNTDS